MEKILEICFVAVNKDGRITIPLAWRRRLGLCPGDKVTVSLQDDGSIRVKKNQTGQEAGKKN